MEYDTMDRFFTVISGNYGKHNDIEEKIRNKIKHIIDPSSTVIELGCANGSFLSKIENEIKVGVEKNPDMISGAKKKDIDVIEKDILDLEISCKYDYVVLINLIHNLNGLSELSRILNKVKKLMDRESIFILEFRNNNIFQRFDYFRYRRNWLKKYKITPNLNCYKKQTVENILSKEGFSIDDKIHVYPPIGKAGLKKLKNNTEFLLSRLFKSPYSVIMSCKTC